MSRPDRSIYDLLITRLIAEGFEIRTPPDRNDGFAGIFWQDREIGHFHDFTEVDIRLGKPCIAALELRRESPSRVHPKRAATSPWIELKIDNPARLDQIVQLIRSAID